MLLLRLPALVLALTFRILADMLCFDACAIVIAVLKCCTYGDLSALAVLQYDLIMQHCEQEIERRCTCHATDCIAYGSLKRALTSRLQLQVIA